MYGKPPKPKGKPFSLSTRNCIEGSCQEHRQLPAEFESLLRGLETTLEAAELGARRLTDEDLFLEAKRALNPLVPDQRPYRRGEEQLEYRSAREQIVDTSIADETDSYLNVGGILYSFVSLKELPAFGINRTSTPGKEVRASWSRIRRGGSGGRRVCELHRGTRRRIALASARGHRWCKRRACGRSAAGTVPDADASDRAGLRSVSYS